MNKIFLGLCLALYPAIGHAANFDGCVSDAEQTDSVTTADGYISYRCESTTAEKLFARPDECPLGNVKPPLRGLVRTQRQLDDGLLTSLSWRAGKCSGSCEMRSFDSKETTYQCEVRIGSDDGRTGESDHDRPPAAGDRKAANEPRPRRPRWVPPRYSRLAPPRHPDRPYSGRPRFYSGRADYPYRPPDYAVVPDYPEPPPLYSDQSDYPDGPVYPDRPWVYPDRRWSTYPGAPESQPPDDCRCWR
jgi:hypothetical protein